MSDVGSYPDTAGDYDVRQMTAADSDALLELLQDNHDTGEIGTAPRFDIDPYKGFTEMVPDLPKAGFLAIAPNGDPAGVGFVMMTEARVDDEIRPVAMLNSLAVHPEHRGQGVAKRLAARRIEYARSQHDDECVVYATIQRGNEPSKAVAETWADDFHHDIARVQLPPLEASPESGQYTARPVRETEYETVVQRLNQFYADAELYAPFSVERFQTRIEATPIDEPVQRYLVAVVEGDVVAGVAVADVHKLMWQEIVELPEQFADADDEELPPSIPDSREIRPTSIAHIWHDPGHEDAVNELLETVRASPEAGNRISLTLDPEGPLTEFVSIDDGAAELDVATCGPLSPGDAAFVAPSM